MKVFHVSSNDPETVFHEMLWKKNFTAYPSLKLFEWYVQNFECFERVTRIITYCCINSSYLKCGIIKNSRNHINAAWGLLRRMQLFYKLNTTTVRFFIFNFMRIDKQILVHKSLYRLNFTWYYTYKMCIATVTQESTGCSSLRQAFCCFRHISRIQKNWLWNICDFQYQKKSLFERKIWDGCKCFQSESITAVTVLIFLYFIFKISIQFLITPN